MNAVTAEALVEQVQLDDYEKLCALMFIEPVTESFSLMPFSEQSALAECKKNERLTAALQVFIDLAAGSQSQVEQIDKVLIDSFIAQLDERISAQMDEVIHNEAFKRLESTWKGIQYLVERTDFRANIQIHAIDVDKETLRTDFEDVPETLQSGLYKHVYEREYDTPGGNPISAIVTNYEFDAKAPDIALLTECSKVAAAAHAPFLATVGAKFFGKASMEEVSQILDVRDYLSRAEYIRWNSFRDSDDARYVGLTMPRFLLRLPYGENNPTKSFWYEENVSAKDHEKFSWGAATYAFAANMTKSFKAHGWTVNIRGPEAGGKVESLPLHQYDAGRGVESKIPTEVIIPETRELDLADSGFIPFSYYKDSDFACFFSANSSNCPQLYDEEVATANSRINARLPYIFLAARLGHYLKVLQRENIGSSKDRVVLEEELNNWLSRLVTKMPNPTSDLVAKRPLREGMVKVENIPENPGYFRVNLYAMPHFQIEGMDIKLSLVSQMPTGIE